VRVVAAGVHPSVDLGSRGVFDRLSDGKSVDVGTEPDPGIADVHPSSGAGSPILEGEAGAGDETADQLRGPVLAMGRFRVSVEQPPQVDRSRSDLLHQPRQILRASHASRLTVVAYSKKRDSKTLRARLV
jgi:hypothetical protein